MTIIVLDGLNEEDFRRSIENRLREGRSGAAVERVRALLAPYAAPDGILPERFLTVEASDLILSGWEALSEAVSRHDRPGSPVTALSIAFGWAGEDGPGPDPEGWLRPHVETSYYSDDAYPFSHSGREDLLEGYSFYGCTWSGDCEATDTALALEGIDDLHGALAGLEARLLTSDEPDEEGIRAGSLGACLLSALLVQAVTERIARDGLPRPLCVMVGSNGVYPYFDAPVAGFSEGTRKAAAVPIDRTVVTVDQGVPVPRYSSLLMTGIPRARKRAVLVLEESEDELANRIAGLRSHDHADGGAGDTHDGSVPADPALVEPDPVATAALDGPLLAKKPAKQAWDFRDMLGPRESGGPMADTPPTDRIDQAEPAPPTRSEPAVGPGFALLEPDLQQRLQSLLSTQAPPVAKAPVAPAPIPSVEPEPGRPDGAGAEHASGATARAWLPTHSVAPSVSSGLRARLLGKVKACLARLGR